MHVSFEKFKHLLESSNNQTILIVDIQQEYLKAVNFDLNDFVNYINSESRHIIFMWNGEEIGGPSESDYFDWLVDLGIDIDKLHDSTFHEKEYGYIRELIDEGIDDVQIADLVHFMYDKDIQDYRDIEWNEYYDKFGETELSKYMTEHDIPVGLSSNLLNFLNNYNNYIVMGGNRQECLKEIEIFLMALGKKFDLEDRFIY